MLFLFYFALAKLAEQKFRFTLL